MYTDHETVTSAMEAICQLYEAQLKLSQPNSKSITYDITDLFKYIDEIPDLGMLMYVC
jgi:hypothetical protein